MNWKFYPSSFKYEQMYIDLGGPWAGHKYFGYDLVRNFKPKKIVELGTHLGCSLFSFAQAVQDEKLNTQLDAIDTWQGDKHAGAYDELIFSKVKEIKKACYPKVKIHLIRKTFDEASREYPNNSIDLLHIDGLHDYKMVKHDYETWFNKVKKDGIILLHDTAVKKWGFGVYKLFEEIQKDLETIEFDYSHGLGVVFKDPQVYQELKDIASFLPFYYSLRAEKEQLEWDFNKQKQILTELEWDFNKQKQILTELEWDFNKQKQTLIEYEQQLTKIKSSRPYKLWQAYRRVKNLLISKKL